MIVVATDFGSSPIYTGQLRAQLLITNPTVQIIDMIDDLPPFQPQLAAYLLAVLVSYYPQDAVFLCVVDPGVGSDRAVLLLEADGRRLVGPDNGVLAIIGRRANSRSWKRITWRPKHLSGSFHGRDLFAPVAARIDADETVEGEPVAARQLVGHDWPDQLHRVIYIDWFGNLITGISADTIPRNQLIQLDTRLVAYARTFSEVPVGNAFWYANGNGLVEIAVNQGRADQVCGLGLGDTLTLLEGGD